MMAEDDTIELQPLLPPQSGFYGLNTAAIWVLDGQDILQLNKVGAVAEYLGAYPEPENDGATRLFHYTSKCTMELLVALFNKYEVWNLNMMFRSSVLKQPPSGF